MADKIRVNTGSLKNTKNNVSNQLKLIRSQITALYGDINVLNGMWEGEAHTTFNAAFIEDVRRLETLCKNLDGIVSYEGNAITEYDKCEKNVATLISGIKV